MECRTFKFIVAALLFFCCCAITKAQVNGPMNPNAHGFSPGMSNSNGEEIVGNRSGFEAIVTLNDANLQTLLKRGQLEVSIPQHLVNSVDAVIVRRPVYFKDSMATKFATAQLSGHQLIVDIDQSMIERIDYQPVQLKVYESGFSSVVLKCNKRVAPNKKTKLPGDPATDSPMLTVKMRSGNGIDGRIEGIKKLSLNSSIGKISIDLDRTQQITVRNGGELGIEMTNGDMISGTVSSDKFVLLNRWSDETIKLSEVSALVIHHEAQSSRRTNNKVTNFRAPANDVEGRNSWTPTVVPYRQ